VARYRDLGVAFVDRLAQLWRLVVLLIRGERGAVAGIGDAVQRMAMAGSQPGGSPALRADLGGGGNALVVAGRLRGVCELDDAGDKRHGHGQESDDGDERLRSVPRNPARRSGGRHREGERLASALLIHPDRPEAPIELAVQKSWH
jgi:hypothetical protein